MTDYSRFEASIGERRSYHDEWGSLPTQIERAGLPRTRFLIIDRGTDADVAGFNVMNPGHPNPDESLRPYFGEIVPNDFADFYKRWNGGYLFYGVPHNLLSIEKIIMENKDFRKSRKQALEGPWEIIRFADIGHNDFVGYRKKGDKWVVSLLRNEYPDEWLLAGDFEAPILAPSFSEWIGRLIETDGAMPSGSPASMRRII